VAREVQISLNIQCTKKKLKILQAFMDDDAFDTLPPLLRMRMRPMLVRERRVPPLIMMRHSNFGREME
jgi:hypothetical protein